MFPQGSAASFPSQSAPWLRKPDPWAWEAFSTAAAPCEGHVPSAFGLTWRFPPQTPLTEAARYCPALQAVRGTAHLQPRGSTAHGNARTLCRA